MPDMTDTRTAPELLVEYFEGQLKTGCAKMTLAAAPPRETFDDPDSIRINVDVPDRTSVPRQWPVQAGVPLPEGAVWSTDALTLVDGAGTPRPYDTCMTFSRQTLYAGQWPISYFNPYAVTAAFVYGETGDRSLPSAMDYALRRVNTAYDPAKDAFVFGRSSGASSASAIMEAIPYAMHVVRAHDARDRASAAWVGYGSCGTPTSVVVHKADEDVLNLRLGVPETGGAGSCGVGPLAGRLR